MDEIISSPYVLSTVKISNLLKCVAGSKILYELFDFCLKDFDYQSTKSEYFRKGASAQENGRFLLPPDNKTFLALGFSLLYAIDMKREDLMSVLGNYFYADDLNSAYRNFALEFLLPFKEKSLAALKTMIDGESAAPKAKVVKATEKRLSDQDAHKIDQLLDQSKGVILQYRIDPKLKAELVALYDNFKSVIFDGDDKSLKVAFLGYKYAALYHRRLDVSVEKIEEILVSAGVLQ